MNGMDSTQELSQFSFPYYEFHSPFNFTSSVELIRFHRIVEILLVDLYLRLYIYLRQRIGTDDDITAFKYSWKLWSVRFNGREGNIDSHGNRLHSHRFWPCKWPNVLISQPILSGWQSWWQFFKFWISKPLPVLWIHSFTSIACIIIKKKLECELSHHYTVHWFIIQLKKIYFK